MFSMCSVPVGIQKLREKMDNEAFAPSGASAIHTRLCGPADDLSERPSCPRALPLPSFTPATAQLSTRTSPLLEFLVTEHVA